MKRNEYYDYAKEFWTEIDDKGIVLQVKWTDLVIPKAVKPDTRTQAQKNDADLFLLTMLKREIKRRETNNEHTEMAR